jgi:hypothetical protein
MLSGPNQSRLSSGKLQTKVADHQVEPTIDEQDQFLPDSWIARSEVRRA